MARIFISYRRADSQQWADRIYPILVKAFGKDNVFKDVDSIGLSLNFRAVIERSVINSDVVLILIGPQWATVSDASGRKRLDNPDDFVRLEVEMALRHQKMVIPMTVDGALMPSTSDIPSTLNDLPFLNGANLRGDPEFHTDMERLIENIRELTAGLPSTSPSARPRPRTLPPRLWLAIGLLLVMVVVALVALPRIGSPPESRTLTEVAAGSLFETLSIQLSLTNTATPSATPTADAGATEGARLQATLTQLAAQAQYAKLTATAGVSNRLATSQVEGTLRAAADAATAVALEITQAALAETATQQSIFATTTGKAADIAGTQAARDATATADTWTATPTLSAALTSGFTPITRNADWTPVEQDFDGVTMVLVPAGCFEMGSSDGEDDERPLSLQCFDAPFWIDKYEVTQAQFAAHGGVKALANEFPGDNHPVENITWFEARTFCEDNRQVRLLTEREWEYAARGPDNLVFPWANSWDENKAVSSGNSNNSTADVGNRPAGVSWVGAMDMGGNVWEWVSSAFDSYPYDAADGREDFNRTDALRVLRGGSWFYSHLSLFRASNRERYSPEYVNNDWGFRCARAYEPSDIPSDTTVSNTPPIGLTPITRNADWTPIEQDFDGVTMVLVPPGCFEMGSNDGDSNEQPVHEQCFDAPFWIDKYEVTQAQFAALDGVKAGSNGFTGDDLPVERINWFEARDFCVARGAHLPTEREWEYAARGPDNLIYTWGDTWNEDNAVWSGNANDQNAPVGSRQADISWVGALDMSGNVYEWVSSAFGIDDGDFDFSEQGEKRFTYPYDATDGREQDSDDLRIIRGQRGGSWNFTNVWGLSSFIRYWGIPSDKFGIVGFRCTRDYE